MNQRQLVTCNLNRNNNNKPVEHQAISETPTSTTESTARERGEWWRARTTETPPSTKQMKGETATSMNDDPSYPIMLIQCSKSNKQNNNITGPTSSKVSHLNSSRLHPVFPRSCPLHAPSHPPLYSGHQPGTDGHPCHRRPPPFGQNPLSRDAGGRFHPLLHWTHSHCQHCDRPLAQTPGTASRYCLHNCT